MNALIDKENCAYHIPIWLHNEAEYHHRHWLGQCSATPCERSKEAHTGWKTNREMQKSEQKLMKIAEGMMDTQHTNINKSMGANKVEGSVATFVNLVHRCSFIE